MESSGSKSVTNTVYFDIEKQQNTASPTKITRSRRCSLSFDGRNVASMNGNAFDRQTFPFAPEKIASNSPIPARQRLVNTDSSNNKSSFSTIAKYVSNDQMSSNSSMSNSVIEEKPLICQPVPHELAMSLLKEYVRSLKDFSSLLQGRVEKNVRDSATSPISSVSEDTDSGKMNEEVRNIFVCHKNSGASKRIYNPPYGREAQRPTEFLQKFQEHDNLISVRELFSFIKRNDDSKTFGSISQVSPTSSHDSLSSAPPTYSLNNRNVNPRFIDNSGQRTPVNSEDTYVFGDKRSERSSYLPTNYNMTTPTSVGGSNPNPMTLPSSGQQLDRESVGLASNDRGLASLNVRSEVAFHRPYTQLLWPSDPQDSKQPRVPPPSQAGINGITDTTSPINPPQKCSSPVILNNHQRSRQDWKASETSNIGSQFNNRRTSYGEPANVQSTNINRTGFQRACTTSPVGPIRAVPPSPVKPSEPPSLLAQVTSHRDPFRDEIVQSSRDKLFTKPLLPLERVTKSITNLGQFPLQSSSESLDGNRELRSQTQINAPSPISLPFKSTGRQSFPNVQSSVIPSHPSTTIRLSPSLTPNESKQQNTMTSKLTSLSASQSADSIQSNKYDQNDTSFTRLRVNDRNVTEPEKAPSDWRRLNMSPNAYTSKNESRWSNPCSPPLPSYNSITSPSTRFPPRPTSNWTGSSPTSRQSGQNIWQTEQSLSSGSRSKLQRPLSINVGPSTSSWLSSPDIPKPEKFDTSTQTDELCSPSSLTPTNSADLNVPTDWTARNGDQNTSSLETWPLSLQSVVKPMHEDLPSPQLIRYGPLESGFRSEIDRHSRESSWSGSPISPPIPSAPFKSPNTPTHSVVRRLSLRGLRPSSLDPIKPFQNQRMSLLRPTRSSSSGISSSGNSSSVDTPRCRSVHFSTDVLVAHTGGGQEPLLLSSAPLKEPAPVEFTGLRNSLPQRAQYTGKRGALTPRAAPVAAFADLPTSKLNNFPAGTYSRPPTALNARRQTITGSAVIPNSG